MQSQSIMPTGDIESTDTHVAQYKLKEELCITQKLVSIWSVTKLHFPVIMKTNPILEAYTKHLFLSAQFNK